MKLQIEPKIVFWILIVFLVLAPLIQLTFIPFILSAPLAFIGCFLLSSLTMFPIFSFIWWLDRHEPEPLWLLLLCFFWGAFVATGISLLGNLLASHLFGLIFTEELQVFLTISITAPIVEECTKGISLFFLYILFYDEFDNALDGIIYGAICGLGFAWFENISYYMEPFTDTSSDTGFLELLQLFYARGIISAVGGTHVIFSALTGLAFGLYRERGGKTIILIPLGLLFSIFAHFLWNTYVNIFTDYFESPLMSYGVGLPMAVLFLQGPFILFLIGGILSSWKAEQRIIAHYLADESLDVVSEAEQHLFQRNNGVRAFYPMLFLQPKILQQKNRILQLQIKLAFLKWHHEIHLDEIENIEQMRYDIIETKNNLHMKHI